MNKHAAKVRELEKRIQIAGADSDGQQPPIAAEIRGTCATLTGDVTSWAEHEAAERAALAMPFCSRCPVHGVRSV